MHPRIDRRQAGLIKGLILLLLAVVALAAGYLLLVLHWSYSDGERAGVLQKFSRRGWVFKTWEGELAMTTTPGVAPVIWEFSCRDKQVADQLSAAVGQRVVLHYSEHRGVPVSWFAESRYFIERVSIDAGR